MKVQRCPSCRRGYSVEYLEPGATFECRRCNATIVVGAAGGGDASIAVGLLIAGIAALLGLLLYVDPTRSLANRLWPWERFADLTLAEQVAQGLWVVLGIWVVATAFIPAFGRRSLLTLALALVALLLARAPETVGPVLELPRSVPWMAGVAALTAGSWLVLQDRFGLATRLLLGAGALVMIWLLFGRFEDGASRAVWLADELKALFQGSSARGESGPIHVWKDLAPQVGVLLASACGLLLALGVRVRAFAWVGVLLLVAAVLLPGATRMGAVLSGRSFGFDVLGTALAEGLVTALLQGGAALWLLLSLAATDLVRTAEVPS